MDQKQYIIDEFKKSQIELSEKQADQFNVFFEMLIEKNKVMNLTGITEFKDVVRKHFIDSVLNVNFDKSTPKVLDIGTGAGFPGIPLKIIYPKIKITLLDSLNKRILFLEEICDKLDLKNVELIHGRAEDYGRQKKYREQYDYVVSRAVANLSTLCEYSLPFLKVGGIFISYKASAEQELEDSKGAVRILGGDEKKILVENFLLPDSDEHRSLIHIKKIRHTPNIYPRKAGTPSKNPLM